MLTLDERERIAYMANDRPVLEALYQSEEEMQDFFAAEHDAALEQAHSDGEAYEREHGEDDRDERIAGLEAEVERLRAALTVPA